MKSSGIKLTAGQIVLRFLVILLFVVMLVGALYPMLWVAVSGFKSTTELLISPFKLPAEWSLKNYLGVGRSASAASSSTAFSSPWPRRCWWRRCPHWRPSR